ncbi:hypothetical protein BT69DRAFT_1288161 [Atractiella rhizophila]|nr:hypothetical protein BT69DRAFT_1288161 [Atractiella rhizophila]
MVDHITTRRYSRSPTTSPQPSPSPKASPSGKRSSFFSLPGSPSRSSFEVHRVVKKSTVRGYTDDELSGGECSPVEEKQIAFPQFISDRDVASNLHLSAPPPVLVNPNPEHAVRRKPAPKVSEGELSSLSQKSTTLSSSRDASPSREPQSSLFTSQPFPTQSPTSTPLDSPKLNPISSPRTEGGLASRFLSGFKLGVSLGRGRKGSDGSISGEDDNIGFQTTRVAAHLTGPREMRNNRDKSLPGFPTNVSEGSGSQSGDLNIDSDQKEVAQSKMTRFLDDALANAATHSQSTLATPWSPVQAVPVPSASPLTEAQKIAARARLSLPPPASTSSLSPTPSPPIHGLPPLQVANSSPLLSVDSLTSSTSAASRSRNSLDEFGSGSAFDRGGTAGSNDVTIGSKYSSPPQPTTPASQKILSTASRQAPAIPQAKHHPYIALTSDGGIDVERTLVDLVLRFEKLERWVVPRVKGLEQMERDLEAKLQTVTTTSHDADECLKLDIQSLQRKVHELEGMLSASRVPVHAQVIGSSTSQVFDSEYKGGDSAFQGSPRSPKLDESSLNNNSHTAPSTLDHDGTHLPAPQASTAQATAEKPGRTRTQSLTPAMDIPEEGRRRAITRPDFSRQHGRSQSNVPNLPGRGTGVGKLVKMFEKKDSI